jgi:tetratricopeptide (TPR) repeat protein
MSRSARDATPLAPARPRARLLEIIHPRHPIWGPILTAFAWLWRFIWWVWTTIIFGGILLGAVVSLITSGGTGFGDPSQWIVVKPLLAHPRASIAWLVLGALITLCALLAHIIKRRAPDKEVTGEYAIDRVDHLNPDDFLASYVPGVYLPRQDILTQTDADAGARAALRAAATRKGTAPAAGALGICVFGRPTLGKSRLAWEAMQAELPTWTFVKWPHTPEHPFPFAAERRIVLWLDNLQEFANPAEAPGLSDLPRRFASAGVRFVVVATCRNGADEVRAGEYLGSLLRRLTPIRPADITREEAGQLARALEKVGAQVYAGRFDGTPGALLLGVDRMRDEQFPQLPPDAKRVLRAMKLLRSAGIFTYPAERVRHTAADLFALPDNPGAWREAVTAVTVAHFVRRVGASDAAGERALEPIADVYLEEAVPDSDYPGPGANLADGWSGLQESLMRHRDADALVSLGIAYNDHPLGNLRSNQEHAVACFRAALMVYTPETTPIEWAQTQYELGNALREQALLAEGPQRAALLEQAVAAHRAALTALSPEHTPTDWANTQNNLGLALATQAGLAEGPQRAALLEQAVAALRAALSVHSREETPVNWAQAQNNLGLALTDQAELAEGPQRAALLEQAVAALRAALSVLSPEETPVVWAASQNNLGLALTDQARLAEGPQRAALLEQAVAALRAALSVRSREETPVAWAGSQNNLGNTLTIQAQLAAGSQRAALLEQAVTAYRAALSVFSREETPVNWAQAQNNLGIALTDQAGLAEGPQRAALLEQAVAALRAALSVYSREETPVAWAGSQFNLALFYFDRASDVVETQDTTAACADLSEARRCTLAALTVFTPDFAPAFNEEAVRMRETIEQAMREMGCPDETGSE